MRKFLTEHPILGTCLFSCTTLLVLGLFSAILFILVLGKAVSSLSSELVYQDKQTTTYEYLAGNQDSPNKLLSIPVKGIILTDQSFSDPFAFFLPNFTYGYDVKSELVRAVSDDTTKGIILEIDSPGGTITGSKAISDGIAYYKQKTGKPVYMHISGLGASGAYWVAASGDKIISDTGSLVGSIGVIMGPFKFYNKVLSESNFNSAILTEGGIDSFNITAGTDKDFGDPYKKLSENAKKILQKGVDNEYEIFVNHVSKQRQISPVVIKEDIGALAYDNKQALELRLIDAVGNRDEAYLDLAKAANFKEDDFQIVGQKQTDFWSELFKTFMPAKLMAKDGYCPVCGDMLFLYGRPEEHILVR